MPFVDSLEEFGNSVENTNYAHEMEIEEKMAETFEKGYSAGWLDAIEAHSKDQARLGTDLTQKLLDVTFTYHEVTAQVLESLDGLFQVIIGEIIPNTLKETLGADLSDYLLENAKRNLNQPIDLIGPSGSAFLLEPFVSKISHAPIRLGEDSNLVDGQFRLRVGKVEHESNYQELSRVIQAGFSALKFTMEKEVAYENTL